MIIIAVKIQNQFTFVSPAAKISEISMKKITIKTVSP